jgi:hypothetical protein
MAVEPIVRSDAAAASSAAAFHSLAPMRLSFGGLISMKISLTSSLSLAPSRVVAQELWRAMPD